MLIHHLPLDLIHLQVTLEYQLSPAGRMIPFAGSTEQGRYIVYEYQEQPAGPERYARFYHHDLPEPVRLRLEETAPEAALRQPEIIRRILGQAGPADRSGFFVSAYFARRPDPAEYPAVQQQDQSFVVLVESEPVCWAWSARQNERCAEVAIETASAFRRRGFARQAAAAWAAAVIDSGRAAFYSYHYANTASAGLARSLEVVRYAFCAAFD